MYDNLKIRRRDLPHFEMAGAAYFITWRLDQTQPALNSAERTLIVSALRHFHAERYFLYGNVVMDDHVHVVVRPLGDNPLSKILHSWKSFTAHQLQRLHQRHGSIWQHENYDRLIRGETDLHEKIEYILNNSQRRWPGITQYEWAGWAIE